MFNVPAEYDFEDYNIVSVLLMWKTIMMPTQLQF
jgi:hypothetical protein